MKTFFSRPMQYAAQILMNKIVKSSETEQQNQTLREVWLCKSRQCPTEAPEAQNSHITDEEEVQVRYMGFVGVHKVAD
jgi:hypothetical protein